MPCLSPSPRSAGINQSVGSSSLAYSAKHNRTGWSLGGYVSLAIAKRLLNPTLSKAYVVGILLIDSPVQIPISMLPPCGPDPDFTDLPELVQRSFDKFDAMLHLCELPTWESPACQGKAVRVTAGAETFKLDAGLVLHKPKNGGWRAVSRPGAPLDAHAAPTQFIGPPPATLIRCLGRTPTDEPLKGPSHVDRYRDDLLLGWESRHQSFIKAVLDVDKHHFNVLEPSHVSSDTYKVLLHHSYHRYQYLYRMIPPLHTSASPRRPDTSLSISKFDVIRACSHVLMALLS